MAKRGRPPALGGNYQIGEAERLFRDTGDYLYVALAIGCHPLSPPDWAMDECVALRRARELKTALGTSLPNPDLVMDGAIRLLADFETRHFEAWRMRRRHSGEEDWRRTFEPMPLGRALRLAIVHFAPDPRDMDEAVRAMKKAWRREQEQELADWEEDATLIPGPSLEGCRTTRRIDRVLREIEADKMPLDSPLVHDPELLLWLAKRHGLIGPATGK